MRTVLLLLVSGMVGCGTKPMHGFDDPPKMDDDAGIEPDPEPSDASLSLGDAVADMAPPPPICGAPPK